jgi:hypothetical protein
MDFSYDQQNKVIKTLRNIDFDPLFKRKNSEAHKARLPKVEIGEEKVTVISRNGTHAL